MEAAPRGPMRFETAAIHAGQDPDAPYGAVNVPIYQTSTYAQPSVGKPKVFDYARGGNPTREAFQTGARRPGGRRALPSRSGAGWRAEIDAAALVAARATTCVLPDDVYGGTYRLLSKVLEPWGLSYSTSSTSPTSTRCAAPSATETRVVWLETPSNPMLKIVDIEAVADGRARGRRTGRRRQHVRDPRAAAAARARCRRRRAQRDEVHRRALRPDRRRGRHERPGVDRTARVPGERGRRGPRADGLATSASAG